MERDKLYLETYCGRECCMLKERFFVQRFKDDDPLKVPCCEGEILHFYRSVVGRVEPDPK